MELKNKKINFLGDSITEGCGTSAGADTTFWSVLGRRTGAVVRGYGIGGTRIARQQKPGDERTDQYFLSRVAQMDPDADIVVVLGGTNDFGHGDAPFGTMADRTPDTFYGAMHALCLALLERYPQAEIVIMTPLHRLSENALINDCGLRIAATLEEYVEAERRVAAYYSLPVLDLYRVSGLQPAVPALRERYMPDGLHPNDAGHARIADRLIGFLAAL